jgi:hypothetical protein
MLDSPGERKPREELEMPQGYHLGSSPLMATSMSIPTSVERTISQCLFLIHLDPFAFLPAV